MMKMKHSFKEWMMAVKPCSFPASVMPLVTLLYMWWLSGDVRWGYGIWALANMILFHCVWNTCGGLLDFRKKAGAADASVANTLASGNFTPEEIRKLSLCLLAAAAVSGIVLICLTGLPFLWIGLVSLACAFLYQHLKYTAAGDLVIFLAFGILPALGTSYVVSGYVEWISLFAAIPVGLITVAVLHINNLRDAAVDKMAGISSMATRPGDRASVAVYCFEVVFPFLWVFLCVFCRLLPGHALLVFLAAYPALHIVRTAKRYHSEGMQAIGSLDKDTAKLQVMFCLSLLLALLMDSGFCLYLLS